MQENFKERMEHKMKDTFLTIAEGFEQLAAGYRALANEKEGINKPNETKARTSKEKQVKKPKVTIEEVRAVLAAKSKDGKTSAVKALLMKYDAGNLSSVKEEDYEALQKEAEVL